MVGSTRKGRAPKVRLSPSQIVARQVRMARAALGLTTAQFGKLVGLSANTISHIEHAHVTLSLTIDGVEEALRRVAAIEWLPDTGDSIGIRLHYSRLNEPLEPAPRVYSLKRGRGAHRYASDELKRGMIGSDYPLEKLMKEYSDDQKRYGADKRIGNGSKAAPDGKTTDAANTASAAPAEDVVTSNALAEQRVADGQNPIRVWREYHNMTLTELARKVRIAKGFLSQIETGKRSASSKLQHKIARALGIKPEEIAPATLTENNPGPVPTASTPAKPVKDGSGAPANLGSSSNSLNIQRLEHMARQEGVTVDQLLDSLGKHHERKFAEARGRGRRRK